MWPLRPYWLSYELVVFVCSPLFLIPCWIEALPHVSLAFLVFATGLIVALEAIVIYHEVTAVLRPPQLQLHNVAGPGNVVQFERRGDLKHIHKRSKILVNIFGYLQRGDIDVCQLVSRLWRMSTEENAKQLPLDNLTVLLMPYGSLIGYDAISDRGVVRGDFFVGLRMRDRPYFRNAVMTVHAETQMGRTATSLIQTFLHGMTMEERNLRISGLVCQVYATDLAELFRLTKCYGTDGLCVRYKPWWRHSKCLFLEKAFSEASSANLRKLHVSIEQEQLKNCVLSDDIGHQLLCELTKPRGRPASERVAVSLPRLGNFQLLRRLVEAFEKGCDLQGVLIVSVPVDVSMAQLWPNNMGHFDKSSGSWIVAIGRRRLSISPSEYRPDTSCYSMSFLE